MDRELQVKGATIADALGKLRKERPALDEFLASAGFDNGALTESNEAAEPNYEQVEGRNGNMRSVQDGHVARQSSPSTPPTSRTIIAAAQGHRAVRGGRPPRELRRSRSSWCRISRK